MIAVSKSAIHPEDLKQTSFRVVCYFKDHLIISPLHPVSILGSISCGQCATRTHPHPSMGSGQGSSLEPATQCGDRNVSPQLKPALCTGSSSSPLHTLIFAINIIFLTLINIQPKTKNSYHHIVHVEDMFNTQFRVGAALMSCLLPLVLAATLTSFSIGPRMGFANQCFFLVLHRSAS